MMVISSVNGRNVDIAEDQLKREMIIKLEAERGDGPPSGYQNQVLPVTTDGPAPTETTEEPAPELGPCPWIWGGTNEDNLLQCMDGSTCTVDDTDDESWQCCSGDKGGRAVCPKNYMSMCASKTCGDGTEHCCEKLCTEEFGGDRECAANLYEDDDASESDDMDGMDNMAGPGGWVMTGPGGWVLDGASANGAFDVMDDTAEPGVWDGVEGASEADDFDGIDYAADPDDFNGIPNPDWVEVE